MDSLRERPLAQASTEQRDTGLIRGNLLTSGIGAMAALLLYFLLTNTPATAGTMPYVGVWIQLFLLIYIGGMGLLLRARLTPRWRTNLTLLWLGLFFLAILTIRLKDTPFTVGGINGDARFYTTYITKLAAYPGYGDMFYKDLPAFYPPLYYFLVGRVADWLAVEPFRLMKYALLATVMILPLASGWLWRRLVDEPMVVGGALVMLLYPDWFKPNEWLALAFFVPWWLHWVENITDYRPATRWALARWWLVGGLLGALIFQLYFFWFFVGGVTVMLNIGWWFCCRRTDPRLRRSVSNSLIMLSITALLSSPFWGPYLYSMAMTPGAEPLQNRFFGESKIPLPLYFFENSWQGVVYLGGLLYILLTAPTDPISRGLRRLLSGFALWVVLGYGAILIDMPLLTFRSYPLLAYLLGTGAFLGLFRLWQNAPLLNQRWPLISWPLLATTLLTLIILLFANGVTTELLQQENVQDALDATYPAAALAAFDQLTDNRYHDRVVLVDDSDRAILFFRPIYSFLAWSAHFSHPAGRFHDRATFLDRLAQVHDPLLFAQALAHNRYDQIDYLLLNPTDGYWRYRFVDDNFPNRTIDREIAFPQTLLAEPYFQSRTVDGYTMLQPAAIDPLPVLTSATADAAIEGSAVEEWARAYLLATTFATDLELPDPGAARAASEAALLRADLGTLPLPLLLDLRRATSGQLATQVNDALALLLNLPAPLPLVDATGQPRVQLLGYRLEPTANSDLYTVDLYWEALTPLDEAYTIWVHLFEREPEGNERKSVFDHAPLLATTAWQPGLIYQDRFTLTRSAADYRLETALWQPERDLRLYPADGGVGITLAGQPFP